MAAPAAPRAGQGPIDHFLAALDQERREGFLDYAEHTYSVIEIWLYAKVLGYDAGFSEMEKWVQKRFPKLNRRQLLLREAIKLEDDIEGLRNLVATTQMGADTAAARVAQLSKELRGHLVEIEKMTRAMDRRGLILAGADKALTELRLIFKQNEEVTTALNLAAESVWASFEGES